MLPRVTRRFLFPVLAAVSVATWVPGVPAGAQADAGVIGTVAGSPSPGASTSYGYGGDGGPATQAQLYQPRAIAVDAAGMVFVADGLNHRVRRIDTAGVITTVAGNGTAGFSGDGGPATEAALNTPHGVAVDGTGNLYIADSSNHRIRRVDPSGVITTVAGTGQPGATGQGGPATEAPIKHPKALVADPAGVLYFTDTGNNRVCRIDLAAGTITTVAGRIQRGFEGDGGPALRAKLDTPSGLWRAPDGSLLIADSDNHRIRKVDPAGNISTVAGTGVAGSAGDGGPASAATFNDPRAVIGDAAGNLYVGEELGHRVRRIDAGGTVTTLAGTGSPGFSGDGGPASAAQFDHVRGLAFDPAGNLWVADVFNNRLRMISGVTAPSN